MTPDIQLLINCCKVKPTASDIEQIRIYLSQLENQQLTRIVSLAHNHGIFPLFYETIQTYATDLLTKENLADLKQQNINIVMHNMRMTAELIRIMKLLEENSIEALAFKGPALAQIAYGDITLRQYGDLDILIHADSLLHSIELLKNSGYVATFPLTKSQDKVFIKISHDYLLSNKINNILVELHWRLASDEFMVDLHTINFFSNTTTIKIQNYQVRTFATEELILYLSVHGAKHHWERLEWLLDIALIIEKQTIDWKKLIQLTSQSKLEKITFSTLYLCQTIFGIKLPTNVTTLLDDSKILAFSKKLETHFYAHFNDPIEETVKMRTIWVIQYQLLSGFKNKMLFITSFLKPTQADYLSVQLPENMTFLYYFIRPINISKRWIRKILAR